MSANDSAMNIRRTYYLLTKIDMQWYLCKEDLNPFKTSKMCHLCFHSRFRQKILKLWLHFTWFGSHNFAFIKLAAEFIRSTLSFEEIPVGRSIGISKQSRPTCTCMHTCRLNWPIISLLVSVIRVLVKLNWLMIMFAKQTHFAVR